MANRKNVLLISSFWTGVKPFFLEGKEDFKGMPAFTNTFFLLLEEKKVEEIYIIFFGKRIDTKYKVPKKYEKKLKVYGYSYERSLFALFPMLFLCLKSISIILAKKIKIIYAHGPVSGLAGMVSKITGVPNVRRIYGTFLARELKLNKLKIFLRHPLEYLSFALPAKAVVITNDGTKGNMVFAKIGHKKTPLHFLLNGINKDLGPLMSISNVTKNYKINFTPEICYIARIDKWKRQHLLIDILAEAKSNGNIYYAIIAGPVINEDYYNFLKNKISENNLTESVVLIPGLTRQESLSIIKNSKLSVSFYDYSNLGNVFLESLSLGTPMFTENIENSLELINEEVYINVNPLDKKTSSNTLYEMMNNAGVIEKKSNLSLKYADECLMTWGQRAKIELDLLEL
ncbi:glycosyltransferase [Zobellia galactanivorans]|uniref:glycosyltransferase n=1 Tax=Zobellia galactanivorans (strain DSM 12802 / CCUG 47099 / CIP 106680 / NCIMB 13871 / Dsij) TaxID=63186 RepID=UPI0026E39C5B|nr:glycosyltransferase [Zobellia galactanivorans]MDO6809171.1 glycosyltransferase [Zobellia galactanivorans]